MPKLFSMVFQTSNLMTIEELNATLNKPSLIWRPTDRGITWIMGIPQSIKKIAEEAIYRIEFSFIFCAVNKRPFIYYNNLITLNLQTPNSCRLLNPMEQRAFFHLQKKQSKFLGTVYRKESLEEKDYKLLLSVLPISFSQ